MPAGKSIHDLPDEILVKVFSMLTLEDIVLGVQHVSDRWSEVAQDCKLWNNLPYQPRAHTPETDIINILKQAPKLQIYNPTGYITKHILEAIILYCKDIRILELYVDEVPLTVIEKLVEECQNIEYLSIVEIDFGGKSCLKLISKCMKLKKLKLTGTVWKGRRNVFRDIAEGCPSLEQLDLRNLYDISNADLEYLLDKKKDKITTLYVRWTGEKGKCTLPVVEYSKKLEMLHVEEYDNVEPTKGFASLKKLNNLKTLCMPYFRLCNVDYIVDFFRTASLQNLVKLDLSVYDYFEDILAWVIFEKCRRLKHLTLIYCPKLTDQGLEPIHNLTQLEFLSLAGCDGITDAGILHIIKCSKLKYLNLNSCNKLTNESFILCCNNLSLLREFHLNGCRVEEATALTMPALLKHLKYLDICVDGIQSSTITNLRKQLTHIYLNLVERNFI